jgi:hypothetical protein
MTIVGSVLTGRPLQRPSRPGFLWSSCECVVDNLELFS